MAYDLDRFKQAQEYDYDQALSEIRGGRKRSHWIWYVFPQLKGLGRSGMATHYGIDGIAEAQAYYDDDDLRRNLLEITYALYGLEQSDPERIMGHIDALKLRSSMTLFAQVEGADPIFSKVLDKFYGGQDDPLTLQILHKD